MKKRWYLFPALIIFFVLLCSSVFGTSNLEAYDWWTNPRFSEEGDGYFDAMSGNWNEEGLNVVTTSGNDYEPLVSDLNSDGSNEVVIVSSAGLLKVFDLSTNTFTLKDEKNLGAAIQAQPVIINSSVLGGQAVVTLSDDIIQVHSYNSSNLLTLENSLNLTAEGLDHTSYSGFICSNRYPNQTCFLGGTNELVYYFVDTNTATGAACSGNLLWSLGDWDNDGQLEAVIGKYDSRNVTVFDTISKNTEVTVLTPASNIKVYGGIFYNIDGAGYSELVVTSGRFVGAADPTASAYFYIYVYDVSGGEEWSYGRSLASGGRPMFSLISQPIVGTYNSSGREICVEMFGYETDLPTNDESFLMCFGAVDGDITYELDSTDTFFEPLSGDYPRIYGVDLDGDGVDEIVQYKIVVSPDDGGYLNFSCNDRWRSLGDVDGDGDVDVLSSSSGNSEACFSDFVNIPPVFTSRVLGVTPFSLSSPVCVGTSVTFSGSECGLQPCHYTNDAGTDQERFVSGCGYNSTLFVGSWSLSSPSLSCYYGSIGTYSARVYLQDDANPTDYGEYQDFSVIVLNGTAGITCNIPASVDDAIGSNVTAVVDSDVVSDADITEIEGIITGQSTFLRWIFVLIFTAMVIVGLAMKGVHSFAVYCISLLCLWFAFAGIGMISGAVVFVLVLVIVALAIGGRVLTGGGEGG